MTVFSHLLRDGHGPRGKERVLAPLLNLSVPPLAQMHSHTSPTGPGEQPYRTAPVATAPRALLTLRPAGEARLPEESVARGERRALEATEGARVPAPLGCADGSSKATVSGSRHADGDGSGRRAPCRQPEGCDGTRVGELREMVWWREAAGRAGEMTDSDQGGRRVTGSGRRYLMEGHLGQSSGASVAGMEPEPSPRSAQATSSRGLRIPTVAAGRGRCPGSRVRAPGAGAEQRSAPESGEGVGPQVAALR